MKNNDIILKERVRGAIVGGAIGDAWGYPVEFFSYENITSHYGECGITQLDADSTCGKALISDDTQMTLFTASGLINSIKNNIDVRQSIKQAYIEWYYTQMWNAAKLNSQCNIAYIPQLQVCRAPGNTCMSALYDIFRGRDVINDSKGCGGVMRIAPIPLFALAHGGFENIDTVDMLAADAAMLTHKHPLGYIPAAFLAHVIYLLATDDKPSRKNMLSYISDAVITIERLFSQYSSHTAEFRALIARAIDLVDSDMPDNEVIDSIGEGWVADEAVAIALYCAIKYFDNFEAAIIAAVNHDGDSDSTGSITGNILGAALGYSHLPQHCKDVVELHDVILSLSDELLSVDDNG